MKSKENSVDLKSCELVEVGGKEGGAADIFHEVLGDSPCQAKPIISGCATPQLINDHQ